MKIKIFPDEIIKQQNCNFGILYEDISHAADGGLYAEMVQNRSFEFDIVDNPSYTPLTAWKKVERGGSMTQIHVDSAKPLNDKNTHYLTLNVSTYGEGGGFLNEGYNSGLPFQKDEEYYFSCWYRLNEQLTPKRYDGSYSEIDIRFENDTADRCFAEAAFTPEAGGWKYVELTMKSSDNCSRGRLVITSKEPILIDFDMVSVFPKNTFKGRRNGLRRDIAQMIADLKPKFIRFPGGCVVHWGSLDADKRDSMYRWKNTIGKIEERPIRKTRNYNQSNGLGFYELFQFCEDIGAEPLPTIAGGYDPHTLVAIPMENISEWIDEALDLIEVANGATDTVWGSKRAEMGHPKPFNLKYLCIGNEEVGEPFFERYRVMADAIKQKYPEINIVGTAGGGSDGQMYDNAYKVAYETKTDVIDEHFYQCPEWMLVNSDRYLNRSNDIDVLISEYSSRDNKLYNALSEAAMMTGFEKAECVKMAAYAPLLCNADYLNWYPNLIWYDNHRIYGSESYYVQQLFSVFQGGAVLKTEDDFSEISAKLPSLAGQIGLSTKGAEAEISDIVLENLKTGEKISAKNITLSPDNNYVNLFDEQWTDYRLSFNFVRTSENVFDILAGKHNIAVEFARRDKANKLFLDIGSWQRTVSLNGMINGAECGLGTSEFIIQRYKSYDVVLEVRGNNVMAFIDGVKYQDTSIKSAEAVKPLYYSAVDDNGSVILKAVNVTEKFAEIDVSIIGKDYKNATIYQLSGDKNDKNSFDKPNRIVPVKRSVEFDNTLILPPYSMSVICFD
ncbi:MAG: alpha-L-arabinofuranosidase C-terminal domain-containing protein [bacterium]|nr:alpha-L-arabinofuranosidase C-terminal domain-containing protein [bacterium]